MVKVNRERIKCVTKFIDMMHKWADYHQIKEETLVDLRKEFAHHSERIAELLQSAREKARNEEGLLGDLSALESSWKKVELNYKTGNYFY